MKVNPGTFFLIFAATCISLSCSNEWYRRSPQRQIETAWSVATESIEQSNVKNVNDQLTWQLSSCPQKYEYRSREYLSSHANESEFRQESERQSSVEHRAKIRLLDDTKAKTRLFSISDSLSKKTLNGRSGDWYDNFPDGNEEELSAALKIAGTDLIEDPPSVENVWNSFIQLKLLWPTLPPTTEVGSNVQWKIIEPGPEADVDQHVSTREIALIPDSVKLKIHSWHALGGTDVVILQSETPIGGDEFQSYFPRPNSDLEFKVRKKGSLVTRHVISTGGQLIWAGSALRVKSETVREYGTEALEDTVEQIQLSELRLVNSCGPTTLSSFESPVLSKEAKVFRFLKRFVAATRQGDSSVIAGFFKNTGMPDAQVQQYLKTLKKFVGHFGSEPFGMPTSLKKLSEGSASADRRLLKRGEAGFHFQTQSVLTENEYFNMTDSVVAQYEYRCHDNTHMKCGIESIRILSEDKTREYLSLTPSQVELYQPHECKVYCNGSSATPFDKQVGQSWNTAFSDLQRAIDAAGARGSENKPCNVWLAAGTYYPSVDTSRDGTPKDPREKTFLLGDWVGIFGGFRGDEQALKDRALEARSTLDGDIGKLGYHKDNTYHVVTVQNATAVLDQVIVQNGKADHYISIAEKRRLKRRDERLFSKLDEKTKAEWLKKPRREQIPAWRLKHYRNQCGAAISADHASLHISGSDIINNYAEWVGGGIDLDDGKLLLRKTRISHNVAAERGSAIDCESHEGGQSSIEFVDSRISDNRSDFNKDIHISGVHCHIARDEKTFIQDWPLK